METTHCNQWKEIRSTKQRMNECLLPLPVRKRPARSRGATPSPRSCSAVPTSTFLRRASGSLMHGEDPGHLHLAETTLGQLATNQQATQQIQSVFPLIARGLCCRTVPPGARQVLTYGLRYMCACTLSPRQDPLPGLHGTLSQVTHSRLCGLFLAPPPGLVSVPQGLGTKGNCQVHIAWPKSKSHQQILFPLPP